MTVPALVNLVLLAFGTVDIAYDGMLDYKDGMCPMVNPMNFTTESFLEDLRTWTVQYVSNTEELLKRYTCIQLRFEQRGREVYIDVFGTTNNKQKEETWHLLRETRTPSVYEVDLGDTPPLEAYVAFFALKSKLAIWTCIQFSSRNKHIEGAIYLSKSIIFRTPQLMLMENILTKALPTSYKYKSKKVRSDTCPSPPKKEPKLEEPSMDDMEDYYK